MKSKPISKAQRRRFGIIKFEVGCLFHENTFAEAHHLLSGGNRIGHDHTVPLCPECHWQIHNEKRKFYATHNTTDELMLIATNNLVAEWEANTVNGK